MAAGDAGVGARLGRVRRGSTLTGPLQAFGWERVDDVPGTATALWAVRFLPLVAGAAVLATLSVRTRW